MRVTKISFHQDGSIESVEAETGIDATELREFVIAYNTIVVKTLEDSFKVGSPNIAVNGDPIAFGRAMAEAVGRGNVS